MLESRLKMKEMRRLKIGLIQNKARGAQGKTPPSYASNLRKEKT